MEVLLRGGNGNTMSNTITDAHFGLNFVADYERIGARPWERYDDIVARLNINQTRYPGGTSAETVFDYRNPNATQFTTKHGEVLKLTPLSQYIDYCNQHKINPTIIVPTAALLSSFTIDGHRTFDHSQAEALAYFIEDVLRSVDSDLQITFEIGNEYETFMTSTEYGRIANEITQIITETYQTCSHHLDEIPEPNIIVQAWGYSVAAGMTIEQLTARNLQVISQFDTENLQAVDGVSSHFYFSEGRNHGTDQAQSFNSIGDQIAVIATLHQAWEDAAGRQLISSVSEWNVLFRSTTELGLSQLRPMMELFTKFLEHEFDSLDFWSAQYHATSIADSSGRLMAAGALLSVLKPAVLGTQFIDAEHSESHSNYNFSSEDRTVDVIVSQSGQQISFDLSALTAGQTLVNGYIIGVDERTADGVYRDLAGLQPYAEPDAVITSAQLPMAIISGAQSSVTLDPFETLVLIYAETDPIRDTIYGTDFADLFYGRNLPTVFIGGNNWDTISYITATTGVYADLGVTTLQDDVGDVYFSIEMIIGSSYNDTLVGASTSDYLHGGGGDDYIIGGEGFDALTGGEGSDTLLGGTDSDDLRGDIGDDWFFPNGGADTVSGGDGQDGLSFSDYNRGVSIWAGNGVVETENGLVTFYGIEKFVGTLSDDQFDAGGGLGYFEGLDGDDTIRSLVGGMHSALGGAGDDSFLFFAGAGDLDGGPGDDLFFTNGSGNRLSGGEGDDVFYANGDYDEFVFNGNSGHDLIYGFHANFDSLVINKELIDSVDLVPSEYGTDLIFDDGSSVALIGTFGLSLESLVFV